MRLKQIGLVPALFWLTACSTIGPTLNTNEQPANRTQAQDVTESPDPQQELESQQIQQQMQELTPSRMLSALEHVAILEAGDSTKLVNKLQNWTGDLTAGERFELALLLSQEGADAKSLQRALKLLEELETLANELSVKEMLRLKQRNLHLEQLYRSERKKSVELNNKIEYLKGLERELEETNKHAEEPVGPRPEPAQ